MLRSLPKILNGLLEAPLEGHLGFPPECIARQADVWLALGGVIGRGGAGLNLGSTAGEGDDLLGQIQNSNLIRVAEVDGAGEV